MQIGCNQSAGSGAEALLDFIDRSPSPWHLVKSVCESLRTAGFTSAGFGQAAADLPACGFIERDGLLFAWRKPAGCGAGGAIQGGVRLFAAHTDSPAFLLRPLGDYGDPRGLRLLSAEPYGGIQAGSFLDRDLALAGRIYVGEGDAGADGIRQLLIRIDRPLATIPSLAPHLQRAEEREAHKLNRENHLLPLFALEGRSASSESLAKGEWLRRILAAEADVAAQSILSFDILLYPFERGRRLGAEGELIASARLDNQAMCHAGIDSLLQASAHKSDLQVVALFHHEEIGSRSATGAFSSLLADLLDRLGAGAAGRSGRSLAISADMAHASHPAFADRSSDHYPVRLGGGPVLKYNANGRYSTDGAVAAQILRLANLAAVECQRWVNRSDLPGGSTLGPILAAELSIPCVDLGSPMYAMHSARELAAAADHDSMLALLVSFWSDPVALSVS